MGNINIRIGARIKQVRLEKKLSREQIARRIGTCQQTIEKYETGEIDISVRQLSKISHVLNVGITYLLLPKGEDDLIYKHYVKELLKIKL